MSNSVTLDWLLDSVPEIVGMIPVADNQQLAALAGVLVKIVEAVEKEIASRGFDATAAIQAANATAQGEIDLKYPKK